MTKSSPRVLLVDDDVGILRSFERLFRDFPFHLVLESDPRNIPTLLSQTAFDVIISDMNLPYISGVDLLIEAKKMTPSSVRLLMTGAPDLNKAIQAINEGEIFRFILKPWNIPELKSIISLALDKARETQLAEHLKTLLKETQSLLDSQSKTLGSFQTQLFPRHLQIPKFDIWKHYQQVEGVSGDYYDMVPQPPFYWIFLGDVTGHGLDSGILTFMVQSTLRSIVQTGQWLSPKEVSFLANQILYENFKHLSSGHNMAVSLASLLISPETKKMTVSGSHENIYVYRAQTKVVESVPIRDLPVGLGFSSETNFSSLSEKDLALDSGDSVWLVTDGILEAAPLGDPARGLFGEKRLITFIQENGLLDSKDQKKKLFSLIESYTKKHYYDDMTVIVLRAK